MLSKLVLVLFSILNIVLIVSAQPPNMFTIQRNNVQQLQSFVLQNLENSLQDMNKMVTDLTGNPAVQRIFIINSNHQLQNIRSNNLYTTFLRGPNFESTHVNSAFWSSIPNMQLNIGTIDTRSPTPDYDNSVTFNRPPAFVQEGLYHDLPKTPIFIGNTLKEKPYKPLPYTTTPINTFVPEYATPAPVKNEENNGNNDKINDDDQVYDIDIRHA